MLSTKRILKLREGGTGYRIDPARMEEAREELEKRRGPNFQYRALPETESRRSITESEIRRLALEFLTKRGDQK